MRKVVHPEPTPPLACASCRAFRAEVVCPVGDGAADLCYLCAHHVAVHEVSLGGAPSAECECGPEEVYPADVRAAMGANEPGTYRHTVAMMHGRHKI